MRKTIITAGVCGAGLMVLAGASSVRQSDTERIAELEAHVELLETRISKLEYVVHEALDEEHGRDLDVVPADAPASAPNGRYMIVDSITVSDHQEDHSREIERLRREVQSLEQTILTEERNLARISGETSGNRQGNSRKDTRYKAQQSVISNYRRALQNKEREIAKLEAAEREQKQLIQGRAGDVVITLLTRRDLSSQLSDINADSYVTWAGKRISMNEGTETWEVTRVTALE